MRKIVLDTNCLLMSLPRISPYRKIWDDFLKGKLTLCFKILNEVEFPRIFVVNIKDFVELLLRNQGNNYLN